MELLVCLELNMWIQLNLALTVTGCVSTSVFAPLVCVPAGIASSTVGINVSAIIPGIKRYKSVIKKKKKKKHGKIVFLGEAKLDTIEVLISKALVDSYISDDEFVSLNNVLREFNEMKQVKGWDTPQNFYLAFIDEVEKQSWVITCQIIHTMSPIPLRFSSNSPQLLVS